MNKIGTNKLIESNNYNKEINYLNEAYKKLLRKVENDDIYVVGSTAGKIYLDNNNNYFIKNKFFQSSEDVDILIKNIKPNDLSEIISEHSHPAYKIIFNDNKLEILYSPFDIYKINENIDIFINDVCAISSDKNTYKIEGKVIYNKYSINAPEKPFIFATYINPLSINLERLDRFFILALDEYNKNGDEKLKSKITDTLYYVANGSNNVDNIKETIMKNDPNNKILLEERFIDYDGRFKLLSDIIYNSSEYFNVISKLSGFTIYKAEKVIKIIKDKIKKEYDEILKEVKN